MRKSAVLTAAAALLAAPCVAQPGPETDQSPIVVEGRRDQAHQIGELLKALPMAGPGEHIARFEAAACPVVIGLPADRNLAIVRRMRIVAAGVGIRVGKAGCAPNVVVIVAPDKSRLLDEIERHHPYLLANLSRRDVAALKASRDPTALWHLRQAIAADGRWLSADAVAGVIVNRTTARPSRLRDFAHPSLTGAVLVVETRALIGLTTTQVADYAVMRAFTGLDPARIPADSPQTILKLLDTPMGGETPITLTRWDIAFIRSFYGSDVDNYAPAQRGQIAAGMRRELQRPDPAAPKPK